MCNVHQHDDMNVSSFLFCLSGDWLAVEELIESLHFPDIYKSDTRLALHNATSASLDELVQHLEESGSSSVDLYNGNFSLLLDLAPHMAALNVNVWEMPEISITTIYNDTAQHSLPIVINLLSNAFYRLEAL